MRFGGVFLICLLAVLPADAFTVIFQNGKTLEGTLIEESADAIRFRDVFGVEYNLKKEILNIPAMLNKNPETRPAAAPVAEKRHAEITLQANKKRSLAEIGRDNKKNRTGKAPVLKTRPNPSMPAWPKTLPDLEAWIARTQRELQSLSGRCRAAGGSPNAKRTFQTNTYSVEGRQVTVSGYWADPDEIESARRICTQALLTEKALELARLDLQKIQSYSSATTAGR